MDHSVWLAPLQSFAILGSVVAAWSCMRSIIPWPPHWASGLVFAVSMGLGAMILMAMNVEIMPGIYLDFRTSVLSAAALAGGPIAIIAGLLAAAYRLYMGGEGMLSGIVGITLATGIGLAFHIRLRGRDPTTATIFLFALTVSASGIFAALLVPTDVFSRITGTDFVVIAALKFVATAFTAIILRQDQISQRVGRDNLFYRRIFESLPDSLNVKDADGKFVAANPATARLMQAKDSTELTGKTDFDYYSHALAEKFRLEEVEIVSARTPAMFEQTAILPDGLEHRLMTLKAPLFDRNGAFLGLITHNRDITETETLKRDLKDVRGLLQDAIDNMSDGLAMFDSEGRLTYCNGRYLKLFPMTAHLRIPGATLQKLVEASLACGETLPDRESKSPWQAASFGPAEGAQYVFQTFEGRWLEAHATPVSQGTLRLIVDVTEKRLAQIETEKTAAEYHALFDNSVAGIFRSTIDGVALKVNPAMARLSGFDSADELVAAMNDIAHQWYVDPSRRADFQQMITREGKVTDFVSEVRRHKTGERIWVSEAAWIVYDNTGNPAYYEGTAVEITDRKRAEEEMQRTNLKLLSLAATDGLTGLMNRRSFDEILERELTATAARGAPLSLILIDVDNFKAYNDRYGHQAGDDCLRFLAQVLKTACRSPSDIACRYGGEEMAIILPGTSAKDALAIANRLSEGVRGLNIQHEASRKGMVTVSAGVATATSRTSRKPALLIRNADDALYAAKGNGRDRVEAYVAAEKRPSSKVAG